MKCYTTLNMKLRRKWGLKVLKPFQKKAIMWQEQGRKIEINNNKYSSFAIKGKKGVLKIYGDKFSIYRSSSSWGRSSRDACLCPSFHNLLTSRKVKPGSQGKAETERSLRRALSERKVGWSIHGKRGEEEEGEERGNEEGRGAEKGCKLWLIFGTHLKKKYISVAAVQRLLEVKREPQKKKKKRNMCRRCGGITLVCVCVCVQCTH